MNIANRPITTIIRSTLEFRHYRALANSFTTYQNPFTGLYRYVLNKGTYPAEFTIRTPLGPISPTLFTSHDILTVNEIFCRKDYSCPRQAKVIVDFGSNIGLSALYFLTRNDEAFCYLYEPLPDNIRKLQHNLAPFKTRYHLEPKAIYTEEREVTFSLEPTGRYGGIDKGFASTIKVQALAADTTLQKIIERHGKIDVLKIDIESYEKDIITSLPQEVLEKIDLILVEQKFSSNPMDTHSYRQYGSVARFTLKSRP